MSKAKIYWQQLMDDLGVAPDQWRPFWRDLERRYREDQRYYHRLRHIGHFLDVLQQLCAPGQPSAEQLIAAFFHDAIYDPTRHDNEVLSAKLAHVFLKAVGLEKRFGGAVHCLIMATAGHNVDKAFTNAQGASGVKLGRRAIAQFLDSDLAILAANRGAYKTYCRNIAREYSHLSAAQFKAGRAGFLRAFLSDHDKRLYHSPLGSSLFEAPARANLAWELASLENA
jgi:predicted metal-dependent HD superfamily phosphohydrolase